MGKGIFGLIQGLRDSQSGNIFFTLFGAVALVGAVGAASMTVMKGPVRSMSEVTKRTIAENNMMASSKLAVMTAVNGAGQGDCDTDGLVEPTMFEDPGANPAPVGGGLLPASIGASLQDPWQSRYGYCVWDHGPVVLDAACEVGGVANRLAGANQSDLITLAVISAGPDRIFQTSCITAAAADANGDSSGTIGDVAGEDILVRVSGSDDIIHSYTYAEANIAGGGLWNLKSGDDTVAEIQKDLNVKDSGGNVTFSLDSETGVGEFVALKVDNIYSKTLNGTVMMQSPLRAQNVTGLGQPVAGTGGGGSGDDLGSHIATQDLDMGAFNIINLDNVIFNGVAGDPPVYGGGGGGGGGSDNLGDHIATQALVMGSFNITGTKFTVENALASGVYDDATSNAPYSRVNADSFHTNGLGVGQMFIEGYAIDANNTIRIGTGLAGGQTAKDVVFGASVTAVSYLHSSDRNLKDQIEAIADPFGLLDAIHGKHYVWKKDGVAAYGVIAQDVEAVMPEAVRTGEDGYMAVEYDQLIAPMIEAIKQLKAENIQLREDINALKEQR